MQGLVRDNFADCCQLETIQEEHVMIKTKDEELVLKNRGSQFFDR